jgi:hypothetical protein
MLSLLDIVCRWVRKKAHCIHFEFRLKHNKMWNKSGGMNASEGTVYLHSYLNYLVPLSIILVMVLPAYRHTDLTHYCHLLFTAYSFLASLFLFFIPFDLIFNSALLSTDP